MIDLRDIDGASSLVVELFPDLTKTQAEIALGVMTRGCHGGYGTAWVPLAIGRCAVQFIALLHEIFF